MTKILFADVHLLFCNALSHLFPITDQYQVCGFATDISQLNHQITNSQTDLAIISAPVFNSHLKADFYRLRARKPRLRILLLTEDNFHLSNNEISMIRPDRVLSKSMNSQQLVIAVEKLKPTLLRDNRLQHDIKNTRVHNSSINTAITSREREIIFFISKGMTSQEIADTLCLSINTIKGHRKNIFRKLNIDKVSDVIHYAVKHGISR